MPRIELPTDMTAIQIREAGPPGVLTPVRRPLPVPAAGEVLIKVSAAGVNRPDCLQRRGLYPPPDGASDLPGLEVSGTVADTGDDSSKLKVGDKVCALLAGGGYAEYCAVPAVQCLPVPNGFNMVQAAALPETFFTVWTNVFERGRLRAGESILIHGGASGIGTTAIQLAKTFDARVFATVGNDEKRALCESLGADQVVNYNNEDFFDVIKAASGGVDVILDIVGGNYFEDNIKLLATDGRLVIIGVLGGAVAELNIGRLLTRRLTVTGSTLRARKPADKGKIAAALLEHVWPKFAAGQIAPVIQATFALAEAFRAHEIVEANQTMGKLVLIVSEEH